MLLKDCIEIKNGKDYSDLSKGDIPVYGTGGVFKYVDRYLYDGSALLLPRKGSLNNVMYIEQGKFWTVDTMFYAICKNNEANLKYIYYYLTLFNIAKLDVGSTIPSMTASLYYQIDIPLPNIQTQNKIVEVLSNIDSQINRNNHISKSLQVLAQTTYSRWFNQFEFPNEKGLPYKSSGGKMIWNDELKQEIPDGWSTALVGNATKCCLGGTPSRDKIEYWNGNINWINSGEVANFPIIETKEKITESGLQYSATEIMPPKTVIISITGNIRFSINAIPCCANQSVVGVFETEKLPISYLYFALLENEQKYVKQMTGAIQKHINKDIIEKTTILTPNNQVIQQYNNIVDTIIEQMLILSKQTFELNNLKNNILPLLINGQLNI